jgi:hypothetical protein
VKDDLMVRVGADAHAAALARPHTRPMDFTGRPMVGYVFVAPEGVVDDDALAAWIAEARAHVATLPAKSADARKSPKAKHARKQARARR